MLALRLTRAARPAVQLRRLLVAAASAGTGFVLLGALGYAMGHPENPGGAAALRLAWCVVPIAATVYFAHAVARTDPGTRPRPGLSAVGLGPARLMAISALTTALACALGSILALLLFLHLRGDLTGMPFDGAAAQFLAAGNPLPVPAALTLLALVPTTASLTVALALRPRDPRPAVKGACVHGRFGAHGHTAARETFGAYGRFAARGRTTVRQRGVGPRHAGAESGSGSGSEVIAPESLGVEPGSGGLTAGPDGVAAGSGEAPGSGSVTPESRAVAAEAGTARTAASGAKVVEARADVGVPESGVQDTGVTGADRSRGRDTGVKDAGADRSGEQDSGSKDADAGWSGVQGTGVEDSGSGWSEVLPSPAPLREAPAGLPWGITLVAAGLAVQAYAGRSAPAPTLAALPAEPAAVLAGWILTALGLVLAAPGLTHLCGRLLQSAHPGALRLLAGRVLMAEATRIGRPLGVVCAVAAAACAMTALDARSAPAFGPLSTIGTLVVTGCTLATLLTAAVEARQSRADTTAALLRLGAPATMLRGAAALRAAALLGLFVPLTLVIANLAVLAH